MAIVSRAEDGHERVRVNTRQGMASVREEGNAVNLIPSSPAVHLAVALSYAMSGSGRGCVKTYVILMPMGQHTTLDVHEFKLVI